ncbi:MAG: hypothetical protein ACE37F_25200 [Nannocystaceae bacterium]|nr:hypothetical protein [bacterium]
MSWQQDCARLLRDRVFLGASTVGRWSVDLIGVDGGVRNSGVHNGDDERRQCLGNRSHRDCWDVCGLVRGLLGVDIPQ